MTITCILRRITLAATLAIAPAASAQMLILRPEPDKVVKPATPAVTVAQASQKVKASRERQEKRAAVKRRRVIRPVSSAAVSPAPAPAPAEPAPGFNLADYAGPRPESQASRLIAASTSARQVGDLSVNIPDCITIEDEGPDFFTGTLDNLLEIESWQFDSSYKLSTPAAYTRYIEQLYGGLEKNTTEGNRTDLSGFDTRSGRNYHVTMLTDGDRLYVTRMIYKPALERPMTDSVIPSLIN